MSSLTFRAMGAAALDPSAYEDVEHDRRANIQAIVVVLVSSLAAGIGAAGHDGPRLATILGFSTVALASWLGWAALIQHIGGRLYPEPQTHVDFGQLVRTIGFAAAPGLLQIMALFTTIRWYVFAIAWMWMLAAMIVAVRQALDYKNVWHAARVCVIALAIVLAAVIVFGLGFGTVVS